MALAVTSLLPRRPRADGSRGQFDNEVFLCPNASDDFSGLALEEINRAYSYTGAAHGSGINDRGTPATGGGFPRNLQVIPDHTQIPIVVDSKQFGTTWPNTLSNITWNAVKGDMAASSIEQTPHVAFRQNGNTNILYLDTSVRPMGFPEFKEFEREIWMGL